MKDVTGYDLIHLMVGSEGTLGIFTKIILKLLPLPRASVDLLCLFPTTEQAISAVPKIMTAGGVIPTAIEYMDKACMRTACEYVNEHLPSDCGATLLITVDGSDAAQVQREYDAIGEQALASGATEVYVADNRTTSERIWRVRRNLAESIALISRNQINEDLTTPMSAIPQLVKGLEEIAERHGTRAFCYGHAGDGNIHARIVKPTEWSVDRWRETAPSILKDIYAFTRTLGGVISGEHGIGHKRKAYLPLVCPSAFIESMKAIKRALDPNNVLNPGKIIDI
jgi:glycolate oxidase